MECSVLTEEPGKGAEHAVPGGAAAAGKKPAAKTAAETSVRAALERSHSGVAFGGV